MPTQRSAAKKVKQLLSGGGITRNDSDDELGDEDLEWEWIYSPTAGHKEEKIAGARFGNFQCKLGDCVLLKAEGYKEAWVAMICEFEENEEDGKAARFMWFSSEKEIRNKYRKRTDALKNELYITPAFDINPLSSINGSAKIMSPGRFKELYPSGNISSRSKDYGKVFVCRRGCNVRTATYTEEFVWEDVYTGVEDLDVLVEKITVETKASRKTKRKTKETETEVLFVISRRFI
jgi:origin recognition complex subunit 1